MTINESTVARMAGNIAAGLVAPYNCEGLQEGADYSTPAVDVATRAVEIARAIVALATEDK